MSSILTDGSLAVVVNGMTFPNPFVIGSGPPSTNATVISKAFAAGWGGVVAKTTSLTDNPVVNVQPRYGKLNSPSGDPIGFQNIELISDRPFEDWEVDFFAVAPGKQSLLIQVCSETGNPATLDRELRALRSAMTVHPAARPMLVTLDGAPPPAEVPDGVIWWPAARWLLEPED